ncbi:unnamed protein product [Owenia fusiformis]|uniref:Uncharacterized protein n=1 Tax=Owenia fusiformis TaxID=6347 RepID=A0A8J1U265_OWEFU|nr:unnamed protein product [Owenia fusiformis]
MKKNQMQKKINERQPLKWITTILLFASYTGLGMTEGLLPTTFLDLRDQLGVDTAKMSFAFTTRYAGIGLGGIAAGCLTNMKSVNKTLLVGAYMMVASVLVIVMPWLHNFALVMLLIGTTGILNGTTDTVHNVLMILTWGQQSGPYLQGLHLSYSVGAFITQAIAIPFLSTSIYSAHNNTESMFFDEMPLKNSTKLSNGNLMMNESNNANTFNGTANCPTYATIMTKSYIQFLYMIIGVYIGVMGLSYCILARFNRKNNYTPVNIAEDGNEATNQTNDKLPRYYKIKFLMLLGLIFFSFGSLQTTIGGLLIPFVVQCLQWTKPKGSLIRSAFLIAFPVSSLLSIPIFATKFISVTQLIVMNVTMILSSGIIFAIFVQKHFIVIWITMLISGIGQAGLFVPMLLWYKENIMSVTTGLIPSIQISTQCLGAVSVPLLTGYLIDKVQVMCFPYVIMTFSILISSLSCVTYGSARLYKKRCKQKNKNVTELIKVEITT